MIPVLIAAAVIFGLPTLYFAVRSREFRKFLAGAFFVSAGTQLYFYLENISVPVMWTSLLQTPAMSGVRSLIHFVLFLTCFYFGFIRKPGSARTDGSWSL
jgi:hypothetical protein